MTTTRRRILLSWSTGKDSAWALQVLRQDPNIEIVGLLTTFNETFDLVAMHAVRRELVEAQAAAADLPLVPVMLPYPCTNEVYEQRMRAALAEAKTAGVTHMAFGDLFLVDVREYRVRSEIAVSPAEVVDREGVLVLRPLAGCRTFARASSTSGESVMAPGDSSVTWTPGVTSTDYVHPVRGVA
jgi:diphthamide synthase (EF-2-diphthine--ammonia ligase)